MKKDIHPTYHDKVTIQCACGASFTTGSTRDDIKVEICSACHPFFTGKQKLVDTAGRVDKFRAKLEASKKIKEAISPKNEVKKEKENDAASLPDKVSAGASVSAGQPSLDGGTPASPKGGMWSNPKEKNDTK